MEQVVFSIKDGTLEINNLQIELWGDSDKETTLSVGKCNQMCATTNSEFKEFELIHILPQSILYPTDEELAKSALFNIEKLSMLCVDESEENIFEVGFINGRRSVRGEFHLTRERLEVFAIDVAAKAMGGVIKGADLTPIIDALKYPIFPHTITVQKEGDVYDWKNLKAEY